METKLCLKVFLTSSKFVKFVTLKLFILCSIGDLSFLKDFLTVHFCLCNLSNLGNDFKK